jgi:hypothetical protein
MRLRPIGYSAAKVAVLAGLAIMAFAVVGASSASAAPLFTQCPPVELNTGCAILITINPDGTVTVAGDPTPPNNGPYDGSEDTLVGVQNNAAFAVSSLSLSSATLDLFGFDGDGPCSQVTTPPPGCPSTAGFGPTGYEGPNNTFSNISADLRSGTVNFTTPLAPGGSAYFALEETLTAADITPGVVGKPVCPAVPANAVAFHPRRPKQPTVPGVRAKIDTAQPSQLSIHATLDFKQGGKTRHADLGTFSKRTSGTVKVRVPLPNSLRGDLSFGTKVTLHLAITATPLSFAGCASPTTTQKTLNTRVVHVLPVAQQPK